MTKEDKIILEVYMKGFKDELNGKFNQQQETELLINAYNLGKIDAIVGDECESNDMQTDKEIVDSIKESNVC